MLAERVPAVPGKNRVLKALVEIADILHLSLRSVFGGFHSNGLAAGGDKAALFAVISVGKLHFKNVAARIIDRVALGGFGDLDPLLRALDKARKSAVSAALRERIHIEILVAARGYRYLFVGIVKVCNVNTLAVRLDAGDEQVNALIVAIGVNVAENELRRVVKAYLLSGVINRSVPEVRIIAVICDKAPLLALAHTEKVGFLGYLDIIGLLCHLPAGVAPALDIVKRAVILGLALFVVNPDSAGFLIALVGMNRIHRAGFGRDIDGGELCGADDMIFVISAANGDSALGAAEHKGVALELCAVEINIAARIDRDGVFARKVAVGDKEIIFAVLAAEPIDGVAVLVERAKRSLRLILIGGKSHDAHAREGKNKRQNNCKEFFHCHILLFHI